MPMRQPGDTRTQSPPHCRALISAISPPGRVTQGAPSHLFWGLTRAPIRLAATHLPGLPPIKAAPRAASIDYEMVIKHGVGRAVADPPVGRGGGSFRSNRTLDAERRGRHGRELEAFPHCGDCASLLTCHLDYDGVVSLPQPRVTSTQRCSSILTRAPFGRPHLNAGPCRRDPASEAFRIDLVHAAEIGPDPPETPFGAHHLLAAAGCGRQQQLRGCQLLAGCSASHLRPQPCPPVAGSSAGLTGGRNSSAPAFTAWL